MQTVTASDLADVALQRCKVPRNMQGHRHRCMYVLQDFMHL